MLLAYLRENGRIVAQKWPDDSYLNIWRNAERREHPMKTLIATRQVNALLDGSCINALKIAYPL